MRASLRSELLSRMKACGIEPTDRDMARWTPGVLRYFKGGYDGSRRASSYLLYQDHGDAISGYFGDFHAGFGKAEVFFFEDKADDRSINKPKRTDAERKAAMDASRQAADEEMRSKRTLAKQRAATLIAAGRPAEEGHAYLLRKQITPSGLVVVSVDTAIEILNYRPRRDGERLDGDLLVVPLQDAVGELLNVELIDGDGKKVSLAGGQRQGAFWCAGDLKDAMLIGLAEGMATTQTLHEIASIPVLSVGGCHNFGPVMESLRTLTPSAKFIVFADRGNGAMIASEAAKAHEATLVVPPEDMVGTDFNDLMCEKGKMAVLEAIRPAFGNIDIDKDGLEGAAALLFRPRSALERPYLDFVIPGLVAGSVGLIVGQGSVGKSFLVKQMALSLAFGAPLPWSDDGHLVTPGKVGVLFGEDDTTIIQSRYHDILNAFPHFKDDEYITQMEKNLRIYGLPGEDMRIMEDVRGEFIEGPFLNRLRTFCKGKRAVFIDPLGKLMDGNENDNRLATRMMEKLVLIGRQTGCAIIVLHHVSKGGSGDREDWTAARGAGAITATARFQMNLRPFTEAECSLMSVPLEHRQAHIHLSVSKVNYGPRPAPCGLYRGQGGVLRPFGPIKTGPVGYSAVASAAFSGTPNHGRTSGLKPSAYNVRTDED